MIVVLRNLELVKQRFESLPDFYGISRKLNFGFFAELFLATASAAATAMCPFHNFITIVLVLTVTVIVFSDK